WSCVKITAFGTAVVPELWQIITISSAAFLAGQLVGNSKLGPLPGSSALICRSPLSAVDIFVFASLTGSNTKVLKPFCCVYCATTAGGILLFMIATVALILLSAR